SLAVQMTQKHRAGRRGYQAGCVLTHCSLWRLCEELEHLAVERGEVAGLTAGDKVAVNDHLLVNPARASVADIVLDGVVAGHGSASRDARRDQLPGGVADDGQGLARLDHCADKGLRLGDGAQFVRVERAPRQEQRSIAARISLVKRQIHRKNAYLLEVMKGLYPSAVVGDDLHSSPGLAQRLQWISQFNLFDAVGCQQRNAD